MKKEAKKQEKNEDLSDLSGEDADEKSSYRDFVYTFELKIPKDRVAVLIGKKGATKKEIEHSTHCRLEIDSNEGDVTITGEDTLGMFIARNVVKAIGRGFNPDIARLLLKPEYTIEVLTVSDYTGKQPKKIKRFKGRVIGEEGKSRKTIETLTETYINVYGKTISIIGITENVTIARRAVESLLAGSPHASVYKWLEKIRADRKRGPPDI